MENFKDPNQLNLFDGMIITPEQQELVDQFIIGEEERVKSLAKRNQHKEKMLIDNGFVKGKDFVNEFTIKTVTRENQYIGYIKNERFETEVTFQSYSGDIYLKGLKHYNGEITTEKFCLNFVGDKVGSYSLMGHDRKVKPNTLLRKLNESNDIALRQQKSFIEGNKILLDTIDKYKKLYPQAEITHTGGGYFNAVLKIEFPSGSHITLQITSKPGETILRGKYDVESDGADKETLLDKFSKQPKNLDS